MCKRSLAVLLLVVALLLGAWSNVIAASFCPRYSSNHNCESDQETRTVKHVAQESSCHHGMADMDMGDMQMDAPVPERGFEAETNTNATPEDRQVEAEIGASVEQVAINLPDEPCGHCWMHSQLTSGTATLVAVDPSKQLIETPAPSADFSVALRPAFTVAITPFEHGPPGNLVPRHVLINVFRI